MAKVIVIGGANVDIKGRSSGAFIGGTSNPGDVMVSVGGVGRNIAENLARLGLDVRCDRAGR
jgi:pseudouridine kinase